MKILARFLPSMWLLLALSGILVAQSSRLLLKPFGENLLIPQPGIKVVKSHSSLPERVLSDQEEYFASVKNTILNAASQYLTGSAYAADWASGKIGWEKVADDAQNYQGNYKDGKGNVIFQLTMKLNGESVDCEFKNSEVVDFMEVEYVATESKGLLFRMKLFVEDWCFRYLEKIDQLVLLVGALGDDLKKMIQNDFAAGDKEAPYQRKLASESAKRTQNLLANQFDALMKESEKLESTVQNYQQKVADFESKKGRILAEENGDLSDLSLENELVDAKTNLATNSLKLDELRQKLASIQVEIDEFSAKKEASSGHTDNYGNNDRNLADSDADSNFDMSFLETEGYRSAKVIEIKTFQHTVEPDALIRHLSLTHSTRQQILSSGVVPLGDHDFTIKGPGSANRELALKPNSVHQETLAGHPLEKVKEIITRYQKIDPQITPAKSDVLYLNCDLGLQDGSETEYVHLVIIHMQDQVHVYAENSLFKMNYRISANTKRILLKKIEKILWDFRFFMYTTRRFLEADVRQSALVGRETGFNSQQPKIGYVKEKYTSVFVSQLAPGQTDDLVKITLAPPVDAKGELLPGSLPYTTRLTVVINTKICKFSWTKDFPIFSMFNTPHLVEMQLKTLEEILNRQSLGATETPEFHMSLEIINPFVDMMEKSPEAERGLNLFRVFEEFNHPAIRTPINRALASERQLTKKPANSQVKPNTGGAQTKTTTATNNQAKPQTSVSTPKKQEAFVPQYSFKFYTFTLSSFVSSSPLEDKKKIKTVDYVRAPRTAKECDMVVGLKTAANYAGAINRLMTGRLQNIV